MRKKENERKKGSSFIRIKISIYNYIYTKKLLYYCIYMYILTQYHFITYKIRKDNGDRKTIAKSLLSFVDFA